MPKLPTIKGKELIKILKKFGFEVDHISGSHHILRNLVGKKVTVPVHGNQEIPKGTLNGILFDVDISRDEFVKTLRK